MSKPYLRYGFGFIVSLVTLVSNAAESPAAAPTASEKAMKYHTILVGRPEPGFLFDRFYNLLLDDSTVDSLQASLLKQVETSQKTSDRLLLAFFYAKKGDDAAALEALSEALEHDPGSAATWYHDKTSLQHFHHAYPAEHRLAQEMPRAVSAMARIDSHSVVADIQPQQGR